MGLFRSSGLAARGMNDVWICRMSELRVKYRRCLALWTWLRVRYAWIFFGVYKNGSLGSGNFWDMKLKNFTQTFILSSTTNKSYTNKNIITTKSDQSNPNPNPNLTLIHKTPTPKHPLPLPPQSSHSNLLPPFQKPSHTNSLFKIHSQ